MEPISQDTNVEKDDNISFLKNIGDNLKKLLEESEVKTTPKLFYIDNGWVKYLEETNKETNKPKKYCEKDKRAYHGDISLDIIKYISGIEDENICLVNVYEKSYITGEPKVEKQSSLERVLQIAEPGDIMLMNMELYRDPYNIPITADPSSMKIVNELANKGVICIFPAGNSCIELSGYVEAPQNYILAGTVVNYYKSRKTYDSYGSNFFDKDEKNTYYFSIPEESIMGLYDSSAAAAIATGIAVSMRSTWGKPIFNLKDLEDFITKFKTIVQNFSKSDEATRNSMVLPNEITSTGYSVYQYKKWYEEFNRCPTDKATLEGLTKLMSPIHRNLFPYPKKLTFEENELQDIYKEISYKEIFDILKEFGDDGYLGLKVCFGVDENGDVKLVISGFCKEDLTLFNTSSGSSCEDIVNHFKGVKHIDNVFYLSFERKTSAVEKAFYISEFKRYFKVETHGFVVSIKLLKAIFSEIYGLEEGSEKKVKIMIVTDSRKMKNGDTPDQEFGVVISGKNGKNPICFIKDRVLNQAVSCPPLKPCV